jgi:serine/threonine-protein kinase HipA
VTTSDRVYVYLQLPGALDVVTAGYFEQSERTGVPVGVFVYNPAYLEREDAVPLDPFELSPAAADCRTRPARYIPWRCAA